MPTLLRELATAGWVLCVEGLAHLEGLLQVLEGFGSLAQGLVGYAYIIEGSSYRRMVPTDRTVLIPRSIGQNC